MQRKTFSIICSAILFSSCAKIARPDADICVVNAPGKKLTCYSIKRDYQDDGQLKPGAQPHFVPAASIDDVNKYIVMDPTSFVKFKAYVKELRTEYDRCISGK